MLRKLPQAVLFDHDGVLVESEALHALGWQRLLSELGMTYVAADMRSLIGKTGPEILMSFLDRYRPGWKAGTGTNEYDIDALAWRKNDFYLEAAKTGLKLYPGVREGLEWLRTRGIKTAVVSNAKRRELAGAHGFLGTTALFDVLISRDEAGVAKPDPRPYLLAAEHVGVAPVDCLAVEDAPTGLMAALFAGIPAAAVLTTFPREALEAPVMGRPDLKPTWIGNSMVELFASLRALNSPL